MTQKEFLRLCTYGSRKEIEAALKSGADVNRQAYLYGAKVPPIFVAVMEENYDAIRVLIEHGARTGDGFTGAIVKKKKKLLKFLVDCGGDINQKDSNDHNPLFLAVIANNAKVVRWIIELGADVNARTDMGYNVLTYTALAQMKEMKRDRQRFDPEIIRTLMRAGAEYEEAMIIAVKSGNISFLQLIMENGADINRACNFDGEQTPLAAAMFTGEKPINAKMIKFLAEHGADLDEVFDLSSEIKANSVGLSITNHRIDITEILLMNGADPNYRDPFGRTALAYAVISGEEFVRLLLEYDADPDIPDTNMRTPLMIAVLEAGLEPGIIKALIDYGADINAQDMDGMTALMWIVASRDRGPGTVMSSLIRTGGFRAEGWQSWFVLIVVYAALRREAQLDTIRLLVNHGADVSMTDKKGMSALACAVMNMDDEIVAILREGREE